MPTASNDNHGRSGRFASRPVPLRGSRETRERFIVLGLRLCASLAVVGLGLIIVFVFREGLPVLFDPATRQEASLHGFFSTPIWQPVSGVPKYGLLPLLLGTLKATRADTAMGASGYLIADPVVERYVMKPRP